MKLIIILINTIWLFCGTVDYTVKIIYPKPEKELIDKIKNFEIALEKQLDSYNWKFPHDDFEKIETIISINIEKLVSNKTFNGVITLSSGLATAATYPISLKKDIYFNELDLAFTMDYEVDPQIEKMEPLSLETLVMFYSNLALGENFDRLSYTDQKNFRLEGDFYFQKLYEFENILTSAAERINWNKRLEIISSYRQGNNTDLRKINAFIYNAVYFINTGKKDRAKYFIEPIYELMSKVFEFPTTFFNNNFYALVEIFTLSKDEKFIKFLIEKDPGHENYYSQKLTKKPVRESVPEKIQEPLREPVRESLIEPENIIE
jgi:hypothetical protein